MNMFKQPQGQRATALKDFGDYKVSVKYANYDAGDDSFNKSDTEKLWLTVSGAF
jgi:hypothetical protein|tara:strand:- start:990 stop:1151 length:162 start_codon:yes stop_codon:yes gene_type:complete